MLHDNNLFSMMIGFQILNIMCQETHLIEMSNKIDENQLRQANTREYTIGASLEKEQTNKQTNKKKF